ncbi:Sensory neuron membrane protein 2 [Eumeta japonica]|uniref:Sensory neuron membrane protein 2 n=1 Tax=Eumeta variegata TaxID=151549 RepID=A0A4C1WN04_EUMVA|nr:Sensory neuron membrane protein 2 [Eumeta japonica]
MAEQRGKIKEIGSVSDVYVCLIVMTKSLIHNMKFATLGQNVQIDADSPMYEKWRKLPIPLIFKVYLFNVTNPEEVNGGERPVLSEVGPYVYDADRGMDFSFYVYSTCGSYQQYQSDLGDLHRLFLDKGPDPIVGYKSVGTFGFGFGQF